MLSPKVLHALVDAEEVLRLAGVGDDALGVGQVVGLEPVLGREHVVEALVDRGALDDLGEPRRDQVVPQHDAVALRVLLHIAADGIEPALDAGVHLHVPALGDEVAAIDADIALLGLLVEQVHVGDERVGGVLLGQPVALGPEGFRIGVDLGQEGVFLHRLGRQRAVEVVDQRDGLLVELGLGRAAAAGVIASLVVLVPCRPAAAAAHALDHRAPVAFLGLQAQSADSGGATKADAGPSPDPPACPGRCHQAFMLAI